MRQVEAVLFDAYGTLFDVHAPAAALTTRLGPVAGEISRLWRQKQLEYTWTLSLRGRYRPFEDLTAEALDYALQAHGLAGEFELRRQLLSDYRRLSLYREVPALLQQLHAGGIRLALLSNGDPDLLEALVSHAGIGGLLQPNISVAELGVYKPDQRLYRLGLNHLGIDDAARCAFVSSNAWDAGGAAQAGLRVFWVNRGQQPIEYQLDQSATIVTDLSSLAAELL
ncbi:MAG TPA: haloacid dehalogenase type II [Dongiaceae bacterium]|nr:haloacid dehalogenase type II [Dongiaceae bacterium]